MCPYALLLRSVNGPCSHEDAILFLDSACQGKVRGWPTPRNSRNGLQRPPTRHTNARGRYPRSYAPGCCCSWSQWMRNEAEQPCEESGSPWTTGASTASCPRAKSPVSKAQKSGSASGRACETGSASWLPMKFRASQHGAPPSGPPEPCRDRPPRVARSAATAFRSRRCSAGGMTKVTSGLDGAQPPCVPRRARQDIVVGPEFHELPCASETAQVAGVVSEPRCECNAHAGRDSRHDPANCRSASRHKRRSRSAG
jgi:hypothetical protein